MNLSTPIKKLLVLCLIAGLTSIAWAEPAGLPASPPTLTSGAAPPPPLLTPVPPRLNVKGYILIDAYSGKVLAEFNPDERSLPASLTKMMTSYVISQALRSGRIHADDLVRISEKAWHTGGSKMFVKVGEMVPVRDLLQGIIVESGNDACIAMAEYIAGSEDAFVAMMNQQAAALGMKSTHFMDATGLPDPNHYSTPRDLATLAIALFRDFPEDYKWYSQKWFTYDGIKQPNRNRLLWRDPAVDGIKTGHTDEAGFCLVASAFRNNTRLVSVVMGAPTDEARADASESLLSYGFRFFETRKLYSANQTLNHIRVWSGLNKETPAGLAQDLYITVPTGQFSQIKTAVSANPAVTAPVTKGQALGTLTITLNGDTIAANQLVALEANPRGGLLSRLWDALHLFIQKLLSH